VSAPVFVSRTRREVTVRKGERPGKVVAAALQAMREARGLTQADLGRRLGVSQQRVAQLESPQSNPTIAMVDRYAAACGEELVVVWDPQNKGANK